MTRGNRALALIQAQAHLIEVCSSGVEVVEAFGSSFNVGSIGALDDIDQVRRYAKNIIRETYGPTFNPPEIVAERTKSHRVAEYHRKERLIWFNMYPDDSVPSSRRVEVSKLHILHEIAHHAAYMQHRVSDARAHGPAFIQEYQTLVAQAFSPSMSSLLTIYYYEALDLYKNKEMQK